MKFEADEKGIYLKKLFKKITIPYGEIKSIIAKSPQVTFITTKDGKEYMDEDMIGLPFRYFFIFDKISEYNIGYRYEGQVEESIFGIFTGDKVQEYIDKQVEEVRDKAIAVTRNKLGNEYDLEFIVKTIHKETFLFIRLLKDGQVINAFNNSLDDQEAGVTEVFNFTMLSYLHEWDAHTGTGRYVVLDERAGIPDEVDLHCSEYDLEHNFYHNI